MPQTAARQMAEAYLAGRARTQPSFQYMEPVLDRSLLLVIGSHSIGMARPGSDLDLELIVPDEEYPGLLEAAGGVRGLWVHDEAHQPLTDIKVRPMAWLRERLSGDDPVALWVYQRAVVVRDRPGGYAELLEAGLERFRTQVAPGMVRRHYRDLRCGVTTGEVRDELARQIMLGKVVEAALVLPLLAAGEPLSVPEVAGLVAGRPPSAGGGDRPAVRLRGRGGVVSATAASDRRDSDRCRRWRHPGAGLLAKAVKEPSYDATYLPWNAESLLGQP